MFKSLVEVEANKEGVWSLLIQQLGDLDAHYPTGFKAHCQLSDPPAQLWDLV